MKEIKINDYLVINKNIGNKNNTHLIKVKCCICGCEKIVSKQNFYKSQNKHNYRTCKINYLKHCIGQKFGDYICTGYTEDNKLILQCSICKKLIQVSPSYSKDKIHNATNCGVQYLKSLIGYQTNNFIVIGYKIKNKSSNSLIVKCKICHTIRTIPSNQVNTYHFSHSQCFNFIPQSKTKTSIQRRWANIIMRTTNPKNTNYKYYGAKGIKNDFADIVEFYYYCYPHLIKNPNLTIDRIDVTKNYSKDNIRFVNKSVQQSNKTTTIYFIAKNLNEMVFCNNCMEFGRHFMVNGRALRNKLKAKNQQYKSWELEVLSKEEFYKRLSSVSTKATKLIVGEVDGEIPSSVAQSI